MHRTPASIHYNKFVFGTKTHLYTKISSPVNTRRSGYAFITPNTFSVRISHGNFELHLNIIKKRESFIALAFQLFDMSSAILD